MVTTSPTPPAPSERAAVPGPVAVRGPVQVTPAAADPGPGPRPLELRLLRDPSADGATIGALLVDGVFACFVLEDQLRERAGLAVAAWKVAGETAIPAGRYRVALTWSPRFRRVLPLLLAVPGFSGIRIHPGNRAEDTEGCLLPGRTRGRAWVGESRQAFAALLAQLEAAGGRGASVFITIENPPHEAAAARAA